MNKVVSFQDVSLNFGGVQALKNVSFDINENSLFAIIGPNGAGKTSLLNCINGIYKPTSGSISIFDNDSRDLHPDEIANLGVSRTFQNIELFENMTALDNILIGAHRHVDYGPIRSLLYSKKVKEEEKKARQISENVIDFLEIEDVLREKDNGGRATEETMKNLRKIHTKISKWIKQEDEEDN